MSHRVELRYDDIGSTSLALLKRVGPKTLIKLQQLGLHTVQDLLFWLPARYEDRTQPFALAALQVGQRALVVGQVTEVAWVGGGRRSLRCRLSDATGSLTLRFFYASPSLAQRLSQASVSWQCFGEVRAYGRGIEMVHPEMQLMASADAVVCSDYLTAVYPTGQGMTQTLLRHLVQQTFALIDAPTWTQWEGWSGCLPLGAMPSLYDALHGLHYPPAMVGLTPTTQAAWLQPLRERLVWEELLIHQLTMQRQRVLVQQQPGFSIETSSWQSRLQQQLAFDLTAAQQRVLAEINQDMQQTKPMLRLVQGDVGCGKTVVAALAAVSVLQAGHQVAIMAPTELLAEQHYRNFVAWLEPLGCQVGWLPGQLAATAKRDIIQALACGQLRCVVGTHALLQPQVTFNALALVVIDEQHRFGVEQRARLAQQQDSQARVPHQLVMTATPIPRSLALSAYGSMDYSLIDALPPGRVPVTTSLVVQTKRDEVIARVQAKCQAGSQAYWVCTLVEESEALQAQAAESVADELQQRMPELRVGLVHGRMLAAAKEQVMQRFSQGELAVLVATTVVEVGVDVPAASLMIIENPERLGLAQLHQLRGRVGRGGEASHCVLLYQTPLTDAALARLQVVRQQHDGFQIAQADLEQRGPGEVLGVRQAGAARFRVADLVQDQALLLKAHQVALQQPEVVDAATLARLAARWLVDAMPLWSSS